MFLLKYYAKPILKGMIILCLSKNGWKDYKRMMKDMDTTTWILPRSRLEGKPDFHAEKQTTANIKRIENVMSAILSDRYGVRVVVKVEGGGGNEKDNN